MYFSVMVSAAILLSRLCCVKQVLELTQLEPQCLIRTSRYAPAKSVKCSCKRAESRESVGRLITYIP